MLGQYVYVNTLPVPNGAQFNLYQITINAASGTHYLSDIPPVTDCGQLWALGVTQPGSYWLDFTGTRNISRATLTYCSGGMTYILKRGQYGNSATVSLS